MLSGPHALSNGPLNGWGRLLGLVGVPGVISLYLVWWLTQWVGTKLERIIHTLKSRLSSGRCTHGRRSTHARPIRPVLATVPVVPAQARP